MSESIATPDQLPRLMGAATVAAPRLRAESANVSARTTQRLMEVEPLWRSLEADGIESPGQSFDFIACWVAAVGVAEADQIYVIGEIDGVPVALLPLLRRVRSGVRVIGWFPGAHVGCNAPLVDQKRLAGLDATQRRSLWSSMFEAISGADVLHLKAVPETLVEGVDIFAELGQSQAVDTLYRAAFASWDEANITQRSKSRRKHDRQQGEKLDALGTVSFEELRGSPDSRPILELMFRQRAARFAEMGVSDPFCLERIRQFYDSTVAAGSRIDVRLHALRLDGEIVALRYNIAHGDRLFCLISSMSTAPALQPGSPGKQCLLRVMQTVFDAGYRAFDMGTGHTDEKRHWCNVQIPVRSHYKALTPVGVGAVALHRGWQQLRRGIKSNPVLLATAKALRARFSRSRAA